MAALRVTSLTMRTQIAGIIAREGEVRRIIFRHICWDDPNPPADHVKLAGQLEQECFSALANHTYWRYTFGSSSNTSQRVLYTSIGVLHLQGNLYLVSIRAKSDTTYEPAFRLTEKFPQYAIIYKGAEARVASETDYADHVATFAQVINEAKDAILGPTPRVAEQDLAVIISDPSAEFLLELPARAMHLGVRLEESGDTGQQELVIILINHLATWEQVPPPNRRLPHANEAALLPEFAKAILTRFLPYYR